MLGNSGNWLFEIRGDRVYDSSGNWRFEFRGERVNDIAGNWLGFVIHSCRKLRLGATDGEDILMEALCTSGESVVDKDLRFDTCNNQARPVNPLVKDYND